MQYIMFNKILNFLVKINNNLIFNWGHIILKIFVYLLVYLSYSIWGFFFFWYIFYIIFTFIYYTLRNSELCFTLVFGIIIIYILIRFFKSLKKLRLIHKEINKWHFNLNNSSYLEDILIIIFNFKYEWKIIYMIYKNLPFLHHKLNLSNNFDEFNSFIKTFYITFLDSKLNLFLLLLLSFIRFWYRLHLLILALYFMRWLTSEGILYYNHVIPSLWPFWHVDWTTWEWKGYIKDITLGDFKIIDRDTFFKYFFYPQWYFGKLYCNYLCYVLKYKHIIWTVSQPVTDFFWKYVIRNFKIFGCFREWEKIFISKYFLKMQDHILTELIKLRFFGLDGPLVYKLILRGERSEYFYRGFGVFFMLFAFFIIIFLFLCIYNRKLFSYKYFINSIPVNLFNDLFILNNYSKKLKYYNQIIKLLEDSKKDFLNEIIINELNNLLIYFFDFYFYEDFDNVIISRIINLIWSSSVNSKFKKIAILVKNSGIFPYLDLNIIILINRIVKK